jgi:hypothetical protein
MRIKGLIGSIAAVILCFLATFALAAPASAADLTAVSDTLSNYNAGATASHTIVFTTFTEFPGNGRIVLTFEPGFNLIGATVSSNWAQVDSTPIPPNLILKQSGNQIIPAGSVITVNLDNITNPSAAGTYAVTVKTARPNLSTIDGPNVSTSFTLVAPMGLTVTSSSLPRGQVGTNYGAQTLAASGGIAPYSWTKTSGDLPSGLSLSSSGAISGTPETAGSFNFTAQVRDSAMNSATKNFDIAIQRAVLVPSATVSNKIYDQNRLATISSRSLSGVFGSDNVVLNGGDAEFVSEAVGNNITVNVSGLTLGGSEASNYQLSSSGAVTKANITPISLTVNGIAAADKTYDGNTSATLVFNIPSLSGVLNGDSVTLNSSGASAEFLDANCGAGKTVKISGLILAGNDSGNYTLTQPTTQAAIIQSTPVIAWSNPADITFGAKLSTLQLNANTSVTGSFTYNPGIDAVLNPGPSQPLNVTFTPVDTANYKTVGKTVNINVIKAVLTVNAEDKSKTVGGEVPALTYTAKVTLTEIRQVWSAGLPCFRPWLPPAVRRGSIPS